MAMNKNKVNVITSISCLLIICKGGIFYCENHWKLREKSKNNYVTVYDLLNDSLMTDMLSWLDVNLAQVGMSVWERLWNDVVCEIIIKQHKWRDQWFTAASHVF